MRWAPQEKWWPNPRLRPRAWQAEALEAVIEAMSVDAPDPAIVSAVMGAGKSVLIAEIAAALELDPGAVVVVTTSTQKLVRQLSGTIGARLGARHVGQFYADSKDCDERVIVTCTPSAPTLARVLAEKGRVCALWIADEAHRTECESIHTAHVDLQPHCAVGFTATPFRASRREALSLWKNVVYRYGVDAALRDGVVVPYRVVPWTGEENTPVDDACIQMIREVVPLGPGVVNANSIADAYAFRDLLRAENIPAKVVHSGMSAKAIDAALVALQVRAVDVVVHVAMLQEGVDLPWLKWLCMRRNVRSPVRFAQEVGRALRAHPGKDEAIIIDPNDLFGIHNLSLEAVLEVDIEDEVNALDEEQEEVAAEDHVEIEEGEGEVLDRIPMAVRLSAAAAALRQLGLAFVQEGVLKRYTWRDRESRDRPQTEKQGALYRKLLERVRPYASAVPERHRRSLREACELSGEMTRGELSELIDVLMTICRSRGWPLSEEQQAA